MSLSVRFMGASAVAATCRLHPLNYLSTAESRRDQEEGGELDSHEEASPEREMKSREVVLG